MFTRSRLVLDLICAKLTGVRARAVALATAARRAFAIGGLGVAAAVVAALSALLCITGCPAPTPANGSISVAWAVRAANGVAVTCESVDARFVALRIRNRGSGVVTATAFPCPSSPGTAQLAPGLYDVSFQLDGPDGTRLATAPDQSAVSVVSGQVTQLAPVALIIGTSPQATLVLSIATGATTNCQPASAGGAGITGNSLTLERVGGGCAAVTFTRQRGAEQRGTYMVDCGAPSITACIEKTETLTTNLEPGTYLAHARGKLATLTCWQRDDTIVIPAAGGTVARTLGLVRNNGPGC